MQMATHHGGATQFEMNILHMLVCLNSAIPSQAQAGHASKQGRHLSLRYSCLQDTTV